MILNKYIALCGITSRRGAIELIKNGKISVNDQFNLHPAYEVKPNDVVKYKGSILKPETKKIYILLNKPKKTITSLNDENGRKTVIDLLKDKVNERVFPIGRLDYLTTGILLLTNDGDLAKKLSHPSHKVPKIYEATLNKEIKESDLEAIRKGLILDDGPATINWIKPSENDNKIINIELHIGKNRIVRRIFEHLGYDVIKLDRIYYAGLTKKGLKRGWFRHLSPKEILMLKHFT
ncbi:MAG: pseudouridine synthase [Saprospiraceae bacterium]